MWNQISNFRTQVQSLENEREDLKGELYKMSENYMKLTNKYTELTDVLANLQQPVQRLVSSHSSANLSSAKTSNVRNISRTNEAPDDLDIKLQEFLNFYKVQPSTLKKIGKGSYTYAGKKIYLKLVNEKIVVKVGAGYKSLQEFLKVGSYSLIRQMRLRTENDEKSFDGRYSKLEQSEYVNLATEPSQREFSLDRDNTSASRFFFKDSAADSTSRREARSTLIDKNQTKYRHKTKDEAKLKAITTSRSLERGNSSHNLNCSRMRNYQGKFAAFE